MAPPKSSSPSSVRFEALDIFRGLAILGMGFSGLVPTELPAWMHHAQLPPPMGQFNDQVFGITWVDLVFPFFLFSMGAAIPLALGRRVDSGENSLITVLGIVKRGLLIAAYALIGEHLRPFELSKSPDLHVWLIAISSFFLIGAALIRWPHKLPVPIKWSATTLAWLIIGNIISNWTYPEGSVGFANYRNDVILMVLANVSVSAGLIWLFTRQNPRARIVCIAVVAGIFLTATLPGFGSLIWNWDPTEMLPIRHSPDGRYFPIVYHFEYHKYLLIALPGTLAGDAIRRALVGVGAPSGQRWEVWRQFLVLITGPIALVFACVGLLGREVVLTTIVIFCLAGIVEWAARANGDEWDSASAALIRIGTPLLISGLLFEPLGGGIRKDSPTFSYFFVTAGLACWFLASIAIFGRKISRGAVWRLLRDVGANPILGYLAITNLSMGLVGVFGLDQVAANISSDQLFLTGWAFVKTLFVAFVTAWFTRRKIFLRA